MASSADVVVIGGGCVGASVAYHLTKLGVRNLVLLEKSALASGPTGRSSAQLIPRSEHPVIARLKWEGVRFFDNFRQNTGRPANFRRIGYVAFATGAERAALESDLRLLRSLGAEVELMRGSEAKRLLAAARGSDEEAALYIAEPGYADPVMSTRGLAESAAGSGARISEFHSAAIRAERSRIVSVTTDSGDVSCGTVVVAAGVWTNGLLRPLGWTLPISIHRVEVCCYRRPARDEWHPIVADFVTRCYFRPDGEDVTLSGQMPRMSSGVTTPADLQTVEDPESFPAGVSPATIAFLQRAMLSRLPGWESVYWTRGNSCVYDVSPDWHPLLCLPTEIRGLYVAAGFSGHGFVMSPAIGRIVAEAIVCPGNNREAEQLLRPQRFAEREPVAFQIA